jgi:FecR protein/Putative zinc-finger
MKDNELKDPKLILQAGLERMRESHATESQINESAARVLNSLRHENAKVLPMERGQAHRINSCGDFQSLIPAYFDGSLASARRLLLEDHIHECVVCRKALEALSRHGGPDSASSLHSKEAPSGFRKARLLPWAAALAAAAVVLIALQTTVLRDLIWPIDVHAMVQSVDGGLYRASGEVVQPVAAGQRIERSQVVRTGSGSRAILELPDGSRIEMNSRSEVWLDRARDGVRINLNRGEMIVTAAKQHGGHLYAATKEVGVAVVGTVFEVNAGVRGSRVTVLEGEVKVQQGASNRSLRRGEQFSTDAAMGTVPVATEIGWSRDLAKYLAFMDAAQQVAQTAVAIPVRHTSDLVPLVPADTVLFASLPNISQPLADSYRLFKQRLLENATLSDWWQQGATGGFGPILDQIIDRVTRVGGYLGGEVIFAFAQNPSTEAPVLLADTSATDQLVSELIGMNARVARTEAEVRSFAGTRGGLFFVGDGLMIASADANQILRALQYRAQPDTNPFKTTALYGRLAEEYGQGIGWLVAADLERLIANSPAAASLQQSGIGNMQQLIVEQKAAAGDAGYRATLAFNQQRSGIAAWLAEPSPMGALEFVAPSAYGAAGVITKDPLLMFDELLSIIQGNEQARESFLNYQTENRVDIRRDLVATLGNELLVAVDGPVLPTPGWKVVIEVNDAARLQNTIEWAVTRANQEAVAAQRQGPVISSTTSGGHTIYSLKGSDLPFEIYYTYWAGYMIIAPSQNLILEAIQNHDTGNSLMRSAAFRSQLPDDGNDYASGFIYQNLGMLTQNLGIQTKSTTTLPSLVALYGKPDRIVMTSKAVLGMNVGSVAGLTEMFQFAKLR